MEIKDTRRTRELLKLLQRLGIEDVSRIDWSLLDLALTHPSVSTINNYEQLEFVGDAVVRLASAELLLEIYPDLPVGEFAAIRSILVSDKFLAEIAEEYGFDLYLLMTPSVRNDKWGKVSRLADAFEGVLGALYQSTKNMDLVRFWLDPILQEKAAQVHADPARQNYKDALQEWTQGKYKLLPTYKVTQNTILEDENDRFIAEVWLEDKLLGKGKGATKKASQQAAAQEAFNLVVSKK
ncbi:ribonuclease III [Geminocystis sp. NIES-3709]|uniref:ribonuclease III n=1 Tax=Geminocystis sp. NIES-3709 TaxID=1617448 RepID=UPI0005FC43D1|nr:ribonuclease III [Geminocystis sp. NIES-3709]BAQ63719.1 ribonuclease III [Geminocystis sp. NIES-3709]